MKGRGTICKAQSAVLNLNVCDCQISKIKGNCTEEHSP